MTSPDLNQQPLCIEYPTLDVDFELKSGLIHLLPTFRGLVGEDPHKHIKEFHVVCSGMKPQGVTEEQVKLRAFPFSLGDKAKDWLYSLPSGTIVSWNELKKQFLENYFPTSRTTNIRKDISGIRQISVKVSMSIGKDSSRLFEANRSLVDAASGGALYDKTPTEARKLITTMAANNQQFGSRSDNPPRKVHEETRASIQNLESQVSQLASSVSRLESQVKKSYNSKIALGVGKHNREICQVQKKEEEREIFETLRKVEVNIPLLDVIKKVPRYAKFLKELCTNKSKLRGNERVSMGENVSAILQRKLPPKCKDPGMFSIPCKIENIGIEKAMCDLGASINVMPLSIYKSLNIGPLKETGVVIQLADRSIVYPEGVLEDILVQVNELIFPADFYVLDMTENTSPNSTSILLGRPFLKTSKTKIDVDAGILSMEFDNEVVKVNTKQPCD
ncbi:UNVERIFIED_CONTAM: hypothetical protein Scaly_2194100 [Sesamum calycinum]|uniref:Retrotransposon gag domain-containing protein n=1 Tax=Sesamum calycinum TaxID=2727403 RepID=A0AAW2MPC3_9LAMI